MPSRWQGFISGLLLVVMPPVGLICLWIYWGQVRAARRSAGEATESVSRMARATHVAIGPIAEPRRPREREAWTQIKDYIDA